MRESARFVIFACVWVGSLGTGSLRRDRGSAALRSWSVTLPAFTLVGHATTVPLVHSGVNPRIQEFIAGLPVEEHARLKALSSAEHAGLLQVSIDVDPDYVEGTTLTYLHGVAADAGVEVPDDLYSVAVPEGTWATFRASGA